MILIYWIIQSFKYKGHQNFGLALTKKQLLALLTMEIVWFSILYIYYYFSATPDTADSFAWRNALLYFRGVLPVIGLSSINDHFFRFPSNPTWECLIIVLVLDYIFLWIVARLKNDKETFELRRKAK